MDFDSLKSMINKNSVTGTSLVFKNGWSEWQALDKCGQQLNLLSNQAAHQVPPVQVGQAAQKLNPQHQVRNNSQNIQKLAYSKDESKKIDSGHQARSARFEIAGQVLVHNSDNLVFAQAANISSHGVFIKTDKQIFNIGEILKLTCRIKELGKPFHAEAQVVRRNTTGRESSGYGLFFTSIKPEISKSIGSIADKKGK